MRPDQFQVAFDRLPRDYTSLPIAYHRIHGKPMPTDLQREIHAVRIARECR